MAGTGRDNSYPTAKLSSTYSVSSNIFLLFIKLYVTIMMLSMIMLMITDSLVKTTDSMAASINDITKQQL